MNENTVCIVKTEKCFYPDAAESFRPSIRYPEYLWKEDIAASENHVYDMVRNGLRLQGMDVEHYGTTAWNPFRDLINPGNRVLIKPNLVLHENVGGHGELCLYTQPAIVAAIIDYVLIALNGMGKVVIGDAPLQECIFEELLEKSGYKKLIQYYKDKGVDVEIVDFRNVKTIEKDGIHYAQDDQKVENGLIVQLDEDSLFYKKKDKELRRLRITNYDPRILYQHHNSKVHEYKISREVLLADVVINVPKPKTHRKAGVTAALKNLVGINANKEYLPHHTLGGKSEGGDAYQNANVLLKLANYFLDKRNIYNSEGRNKKAKFYQDLYLKTYKKGKTLSGERYWEGSWYGNDTIWRTIVDLNRILLYANKQGDMTDKIQRNIYIIGDMIISGEKEGPLEPSPKDAGIILFSWDPVSFDKTVTALMGFDFRNIPLLNNTEIYQGKYAFSEYLQTNIISDDPRWDGISLEKLYETENLAFEPSMGWADKLGNPKLKRLCEDLRRANRKIVLFGMGERGMYVANYLMNAKMQIENFSDNDVTKQQGSVYKGIRCVAPENIEKDSIVLITVKAQYSEEIKKQLEQLGILHYFVCD